MLHGVAKKKNASDKELKIISFEKLVPDRGIKKSL